jgi:hypothetical protein
LVGFIVKWKMDIKKIASAAAAYNNTVGTHSNNDGYFRTVNANSIIDILP